MVDVEEQIARLASARGDRVEPWRTDAVPTRTPMDGPPRRWRQRALLTGAALVAAAAVAAVILVPGDDSGRRVTTTAPSTSTLPAPTTMPAPMTTPGTTPVDAPVTPSSGPPGTPFGGSATIVDFRLLPAEARTVELWLIAENAPAGRRVASGLAGHATIEPSGVLTFSGIVPQTMASAENDEFPSGMVFATPAGRYRVALDPTTTSEKTAAYGLDGVTFTVTAEGAGLQSPASDPHRPDDARAVLGADELAGVALGSSANDAVAALEGRFGPPDTDTGWLDACVTERRVTWGGLTAWFSAPVTAADVTDGTFGWYHYERSEGSTAGLETPTGIRLGAALTDLRARAPEVEFGGGYDSVVLTRWTATDGTMGSLSDDVTGPDPRVASIGAGTGAGPFTVC